MLVTDLLNSLLHETFLRQSCQNVSKMRLESFTNNVVYLFVYFFIIYFCIIASAQTMLTISPRRVRAIDDPVLQMLTQLHKIIYITQVWMLQFLS